MLLTIAFFVLAAVEGFRADLGNALLCCLMAAALGTYWFQKVRDHYRWLGPVTRIPLHANDLADVTRPIFIRYDYHFVISDKDLSR